MTVRETVADLIDISQWKLTPYQILAAGFAGLIVVGAVLLATPWASAVEKPLPFIDALFTATSAVCVTGLVVVDTGTRFSLFGQTVIIVLIQAGGLGIMTMATLMALLMGKRINLRERLIIQEAMNQLTVAGVVRLTLYIIKVTLLIEFVAGSVLAVRLYQDYGAKGVYFGYWHAVSAFCNAGFDLFGEFSSLTSYVDDPIVNLIVSALIICGGIGFSVMADVWERRHFRDYSLHSKLVLLVTAFLITLGAIVIFAFEFDNPATLGNLSWNGKILASYFQSVTARTAGFNTTPIGEMKDATLFFIVTMMFIGASPGSTGGGIKTTTAGILAAAIWALIRGREDVEIFSRSVPRATIYKAFALVFIAVLMVIVVTMILSITETAPFLNILFEVVSAFGTVGLSTGITPGLSAAGKLCIMLMMFAGRVGPITVVLALALRQRKAMVKYPEGKVIIG
ncbi:TrkH family potassium uptake protein [Anaeroselena agilis]|uniref:TrkH family potassium uptake protein n=1 Tax=Anaeroselena agilis TaxID=3063788 RepID=A0ABU3NVX5_9FIRM|nr:TrkH family potassium uptake protein [Selenomonadales bacterium 4137-cl]